MKLLRSVLALSLALVLSECSKLNEVAVSSLNFEDAVALTQNLVFTFNKDLVREADLNSWESAPYVEFSPKIEGKFKWTAPNELVFSPAVGFQPATDYTARLSDALLRKVEDKKYGVSSEKIAFHTPYLSVAQTETYWTKSRTTGKPEARTKLIFNYAVAPQEVAKRLKVSGEDDKAMGFSVPQSTTAEAVQVALPDAPSEAESQVTFWLEKGLPLPNSSYESKEDTEVQATLPDPKQVEVMGVETGFVNNRGFVKITTTHALSPEDLETYYRIEGGSADPSPAPAVIETDSLGNPVETPPVANTRANRLNTKAELSDNGFVIRGDFNETDTYVLTLTPKLKSVLGVRLSEDFTKDLFFGKMPASIGFTHKKALYLSSKGHKNVGVSLVNIPKVNVKIARLYENNILQYMRSNRYQDYGYSEDGENLNASAAYTYNEDYDGTLSDVIVNKMVETDNLPKVRGVSALNLNLPASPNGLRGIFLVTVASPDEYYLKATKLVSVSDIGLITKQSGDELLVFCNSIKTAEPLSDVEVSLVSSNNQQVVSLKTDAKGVAVFKSLPDKAPGFRIAMITARQAEDFNYLLFEDTAVETSRFEVDGKRDNASGFEAFIYGDRNIYRPGETIHFNTVIRQHDWSAASDVPLKIRLLMPNGKEFRSFRKNTNAQGAIETSVPLDASVVTGTYTIEVYNANDVLLSSQVLSVEEFMPDRIKVDVSTDQASYRSGQSVVLSATALNLFGPPAAGRNYEMDFSLKRKAFTPKGYDSYLFDIADNTNFENVLRQGTTDASGLAKELFDLPATYADMGVLEGKIYVTVFDETGRPVNRLKRFEVFTQRTFYGIGMPDTYVSTNVPLSIPLVALNQNGQPAQAQGQLEIVRFDYQTVIEKNTDNSIRYVSRKQTKVLLSRTVSFANGKAEVSFAPPTSGEYEVRLRRAGARTYTAQAFYAYGYGYTTNASFEVNTEGQVEMQFDKDSYEVGDRAKVLFKTPFAGRLLVSIERNKVLEYHWLETDKKSAELDFKISNDHLPNVYVSATLFRAMDDAQLPLTVAHGYAPVMVQDPDSQLPVAITATEKSRSKTRQRISIQTAPNAEVTIAVVDEGILQIKNFKTPDPHGFFYQKRALEVSSYDLYPFLLPELSIASLSSVGGDGFDLEKRINPLSNGRVRLVAFWSGIRQADGSGKLSFDVDIPHFSGDLRVMAVAYKDKAFGSANRNMKVADPLVISTALPRFASPNDELVVPVSISNTTKQAATVTATISTTGPLGPSGTNRQTLSIAPEREGRAQFALKALPSMGNATVTVTVSGLKEQFVEKVELTVRPATSLIKVAAAGTVAAGKSVALGLTNDFIPSIVRSSLLVSKSPMVQLSKTFDGLLGYPHGCLEQTVSKAFPQLYFSDFVKRLQTKQKPYLKPGENELNPQANVQAALRKIEGLQLANGGLSMWQAGDAEQWWATAYALHFMTEAQKAGYEVNSNTMGRVIDYLTAKASSQATETGVFYNADGSITNRTIAKREMLYTLYTLALAGKANRSAMNYYKGNPSLLTTDERYMLAAAYQLIGDGRNFNALLPRKFNTEQGPRATGGDFASPLRNTALVLNTLLETDPDNLQIPVLARQLSQALRSSLWLSTQESSFALLALGKIAQKANQSSVTASISTNGKVLGNFTSDDLLLQKGIDAQTLITAKGQGSLYYFAQAEGLSASGSYQEGDYTLQVRKQLLTRSGEPLSASNLKQNQLVVVKITLSSQNGLPIENVVVTDMLPAGLEIENPRLTGERELNWIKDQTFAEHFDIRDDRINYFTTVGRSPQHFYYLVRAVSKGRFTMGPVSADAMYNAEFRSYSGGGICVVE